MRDRRTVMQRLRLGAKSAIGSVKIKLLLCSCIAFTVFALVSRAADSMRWSRPTDPLDSYPLSRRGYNIVINTWKRNDLLKRSVSHYASCSGLDSIHIVWSEPDPPSESLIKFLHHALHSNSRDDKKVELKFDINQEDSLNNRFKEIKDLKTDAVFSIDDDIIFPCSSVEFAFNVWRSAPDTMVGFVPRMHWIDQSEDSLNNRFKEIKDLKTDVVFSIDDDIIFPCSSVEFAFNVWRSAPDTMVGFVPRMHWIDQSVQKGNTVSYVYVGWWSVWWTGTYSMVLSKASFFHKKYFSLYTNEMPASIREFTTKYRNCEDIAMSFLVANATGSPPIWVKGKIFEIGSTGISSMGGHTEKRSQCVNRFAMEYGRMPLVSTSMKAVDSRSSWFW